MISSKGKVLVTGANGFLGSYVTKLCLEQGYMVRGTMRDKSNKDKLASLQELPLQENLEIFEANLMDAASLDKAVEGCDYIIHVAAPVIMEGDESVIVTPAVEGTKVIMESAIKYKVKAIVITSSVAAVINHEVSATKVLDESDWPNLEKPHPPYIKAKTLEEKAVWEIYNKTPKESRPRVAVIDPAYILGPTLTKASFSSAESVRGLLMETIKIVPKLFFGIVDVRDVALAHLKALEIPESDGQRYICYSGECLWLSEITKIVKEEFEKYGYKIEPHILEENPMKGKSLLLDSRWGKDFKMSNEKIKKELGIKFIPAKQSVIDLGYSLIKQGLVPDLTKK